MPGAEDGPGTPRMSKYDVLTIKKANSRYIQCTGHRIYRALKRIDIP